jgi:hypothetical protein
MTNGGGELKPIGDNPIADITGARGAGLSAVLVHRPDGAAPAITLAEAPARIVTAKGTAGVRRGIRNGRARRHHRGAIIARASVLRSGQRL